MTTLFSLVRLNKFVCHYEKSYRGCHYEKEPKVVRVKDRHSGVRNFFTTASFINLPIGAQHGYKVTCPALPFHSDGDVQMGELTAMDKERGSENQKSSNKEGFF